MVNLNFLYVTKLVNVTILPLATGTEEHLERGTKTHILLRQLQKGYHREEEKEKDRGKKASTTDQTFNCSRCGRA